MNEETNLVPEDLSEVVHLVRTKLEATIYFSHEVLAGLQVKKRSIPDFIAGEVEASLIRFALDLPTEPLKEITHSYQIPKTWFDKLRADNLPKLLSNRWRIKYTTKHLKIKLEAVYPRLPYVLKDYGTIGYIGDLKEFD